MTLEEKLQRLEKAIDKITQPSGVMEPQDADRFIDLVIDQSVVLKQANIHRMNSDKRNIQTFDLSGIVLQPLTGGQYPDRSGKVTTAKRQLSAVTLTARFDLEDDFLEDNIEKEDFEDKLVASIAKAVANDLENLALNGGTSGAYSSEEVALYGTTNGWIHTTATEGHVVDAEGQTINSTIFNQAIKALPSRYRRASDLRWIGSDEVALDYRDYLAANKDFMAADMLFKSEELSPKGIRYIEAPLVQKALNGYSVGGGSAVPNSTAILLTPLENLAWGIRRDIRIERIRTKPPITEIYVSVRVDAELANPDAAVVVVNLKVAE